MSTCTCFVIDAYMNTKYSVYGGYLTQCMENMRFGWYKSLNDCNNITNKCNNVVTNGV